MFWLTLSVGRSIGKGLLNVTLLWLYAWIMVSMRKGWVKFLKLTTPGSFPVSPFTQVLCCHTPSLYTKPSVRSNTCIHSGYVDISTQSFRSGDEATNFSTFRSDKSRVKMLQRETLNSRFSVDAHQTWYFIVSWAYWSRIYLVKRD